MKPLDHAFFTVHDTTRFPAVMVRPAAVLPGYAAQWEVEMEALLRHGEPFAVLYPEMPAEESHEDYKRRGIWLKRHREALARLCAALISVEPDARRREAAVQRGRGVSKAFGIAHYAVASLDEGLSIAFGRARRPPPHDDRAVTYG
ncbi:hypothetical protein CAL29_12510 [Bordetella genomosp. 10]|uniref:Uncharacterized protein n=1 Tax=Bordetella genomosp. 10 TaxID=1416804 RepID=A0A261SB09_9BORD|nr:hypothetical protein [Bordetella genomosp. 10]OZI34345.1 hypothetical protein CAL29_12510 [Bordetella genomosp. 10]